MRAILAKTSSKLAALTLAGAVALTSPVPSFAQEEITEARLRKIESEIRALQRNVFPGGDGRFFEPQIVSGQPNGSNTRAPSTTAVTDILARLDALEMQVQRLTALSEENTNSLNQMAARLSALEAAPPPVVTAQPEPAEEESANDSNLGAMTDTSSEPAAEPVGPTEARLAAVQDISKPETEDPGDDEYSYGFRLWNAGFYPEARQQLTKFVEEHPTHWRITYGRNLLGRAFLDDGQPEDAARWFLRNYQADRQAVRAPDSLLYLAESMIALGDTNRACIALAEFGDTYPAVATGRLSDKYESNRQQVACG